MVHKTLPLLYIPIGKWHTSGGNYRPYMCPTLYTLPYTLLKCPVVFLNAIPYA